MNLLTCPQRRDRDGCLMSVRSLSNTKISFSLTTKVLNTLDGGNRVAVGDVSFALLAGLSSGLDSGEADRAWDYRTSLVDGNSEVLDLSTFAGFDSGSGDGNDIVGQTMVPLVEIVAILVVNENSQDDAGYLEVEPDPTDGWSPIGEHTVALGGAISGQGLIFKLQQGVLGMEIDGTHKRIKLTATGGDVNYYIAIIGRHDDDESSSSSISSQSSSS